MCRAYFMGHSPRWAKYFHSGAAISDCFDAVVDEKALYFVGLEYMYIDVFCRVEVLLAYEFHAGGGCSSNLGCSYLWDWR